MQSCREYNSIKWSQMIHRIIAIIPQSGRGASRPPKIFINSFLMLDVDSVLWFYLPVS